MRLFFIIVVSFILPWVLGAIFFKKDKKIFATIAPFAVMLAYILNTIGIDLGFFYPLPVEYLKTHTVSIIPNIGLISVKSCMFTYLVAYTKIKPIILNIIFSGIGTIIDLIFISINYLKYDNGWNYMLTILIYFLAFSVIHIYYLWLKKLDIL